jgi:hypothetical protein
MVRYTVTWWWMIVVGAGTRRWGRDGRDCGGVDAKCVGWGVDDDVSDVGAGERGNGDARGMSRMGA